MDIKQYIEDTAKQYSMRVRTVVPLDDAAMDVIERAVVKFDPIDISRPTKTILQSNLVDFPNIPAAEVWILDMVFGLPCTPQVLADTIRKAIQAPEAFVLAYTQEQAGTVYPEFAEAMKDIEAEAAKRGLRPGSVLATKGEYPELDTPEGDELFGNAYNITLLDTLKAIEDAKKAAKPKLSASPLFDFIDVKNTVEPDDQAFNAGKMPDAPSAAKRAKIKTRFKDIDGSAVTPPTQTVKRLYTDKNGEIVVLSREVAEKK